jgi:erythromycin esterase
MEGLWYPEFRQLLRELLRLEYQHSVNSSERVAFLAGIWNLRDSLSALDGSEAAFWQQELSNLEQSARCAWSHEGRDQGMGNNLLWLARECFPDEKIIVWAHNWHVARSTEAMAAADPEYAREFAKHPDTIMGEVAAREFGDEPGSLEASLLGAGHEAAFIDLRQLPAARFTLGGLERARSHDLVWAELFDGIMFQAEMR